MMKNGKPIPCERPREAIDEILRRARDALSAEDAQKYDGVLTGCTAFPAESFDKILLDPPCSALGLRPRLSHDKNASAQNVRKIANYQKGFIFQAVHLLKVGGTFTYSTCTINPMENEEMVRHALDTYGDYIELDFDCPRLSGDIGIVAPGLLTEKEALGVQRFGQSTKTHDTTGFFLCKFRKVKSCF